MTWVSEQRLRHRAARARSILLLAAVLCGAQLLAVQHLHLFGSGTELCAACVLADSGDRTCVAPPVTTAITAQGCFDSQPPSARAHDAPARLSHHPRAPPVSRY